MKPIEYLCLAILIATVNRWNPAVWAVLVQWALVAMWAIGSMRAFVAERRAQRELEELVKE